MLAPLEAQQPPPAGPLDRTTFATATLPENNEALLLTERAEQALSGGDYRLGLELIAQLQKLPGGLVALPASRTYLPVKAQAQRLLRQAPEEAVRMYREMHDAEARQIFEQARRAGDVRTLRVLLDEQVASTVWPEVSREIIGLLLERGSFDEAIEVIQQARQSWGREDGQLAVQMGAALAGAGETAAARALSREVAGRAARTGDSALQERVERLERWISSSGAPDGDERPAPVIDSRLLWSHTLGDQETDTSVDEELARAIAETHQLPLLEAAFDESTLIVRTSERVWALNALTLAPLWSEKVRAPELLTESESAGAHREEEHPGPRISPQVEAMLRDPLRHCVSAGEAKVFTIESITPDLMEDAPPAVRRAMSRGESATRNELVARDLATGQIAWRTQNNPGDELANAAFQDRPLISDGRVVAVAYLAGRIQLLALDPRTGRKTAAVEIVGPPLHLSSHGGRVLLTADELNYYVSTGNGVIAAVGRSSFEWKWAAVYQSNLTDLAGPQWWRPTSEPVDSPIDRPIVARDLLVAGPVDSDTILGIDRYSGQQRWAIDRQGYTAVVGAAPGGVVLAGRDLTCLDLTDPAGAAPLWRTVPLEITGRPACEAGAIFVSTRTGIVVVDARNGRLVAERNEDRLAQGAADSVASVVSEPLPAASNLVMGPDGLVSISSQRVIKYPDLQKERRRLDALAAKDGESPRVALARAWLEALGGNSEEAIRSLEREISGFEAGRGELLRQLYLWRATLSAGGEQLSWLSRAQELPGSSRAAQRIKLLRAVTLRRSGQESEALEILADLVAHDAGELVMQPGGAQQAVWLAAVREMAGPLREMPGGQFEQFMRQFASSATSARGLQHLSVAGKDIEKRIAGGIFASKIAPEIAALYEPARLEGGGVDDLLRRWEVHVSLGQLPQAQADQAAWQKLAAGAGERAGSADQTETARSLELSVRKLEQSQQAALAPPLARQWVNAGEMLIDESSPSPLRTTLLVRKSDSRNVQLLDSLRNQAPLQTYPDGRREKSAAADAAEKAFARMMANQNGEDGVRPYWPMATFESLAAVPVNGGLIGVGLGPARHGGGLLWEVSVPQWGDLDQEFTFVATAGRLGAYFCPRPDRVCLAGWLDGSIWWQAQIPGGAVEKMALAGSYLLLTTDDSRVLCYDAAFGEPVTLLRDLDATLCDFEVVEDTIVAWGSKHVYGLSSGDLSQRWKVEGHPGRHVRVANRPWVAYEETDEQWALLDASGGSAPLGESFRIPGPLTCAAVQDGRLFAAAQDSQDGPSKTRLSCYDIATRGTVWTSEFVTRVAANQTQLTASDDYIPLLLAPDGQTPASDAAASLDLVNKSDGKRAYSITLSAMYDARPHRCDLSLRATPSRLLVQIRGNVLALGHAGGGT